MSLRTTTPERAVPARLTRPAQEIVSTTTYRKHGQTESALATTHDTLPTPQPSALPTTSILLFALLTVVAYIFTNGYTFGTDDHLGLLPMYRAMTEPGLYARDWFIQAERQMNVRYFYLQALRAFAAPLGLTGTSFLLFVTCGAALYTAMVRIAEMILRDGAAALLAAFIAFMTPVAMVLGHSRLVNNQMLPNLAAYALAMWALVWCLRGRAIRAGAALGVATLLQGLVGVQAAVLVAATTVTVLRRDWRSHWRGWAVGAAAFAVMAAPNLWLVLAAQSPADIGAASNADFLIYAVLRIPFHVLPSTWAMHGWAVGAGMLGLIVTGIALQPRLRTAHFLTPLALLLAGMAAGVVFVDVWPTTTVAKLQFFRGMTVLRLVFAIAVVAALWRVTEGGPWLRAIGAALAVLICLDEQLGATLVERWRDPESRHGVIAGGLLAILSGAAVLRAASPTRGDATETTRHARPRRFGIVAVANSVIGAALVAMTPFESGSIFPDALASAVWRQCNQSTPDNQPRGAPQRAATWAGEHLPRDAVVLVAPYLKDFRYRSGRAVVVDFKAVPFTTHGLRQWQQRIFEVCGVEPALIESGAWPDPYESFTRMTGTALASVARRYEAGYLAIDREVDGPWQLVHRDNAMRIYVLRKPVTAWAMRGGSLNEEGPAR